MVRVLIVRAAPATMKQLTQSWIEFQGLGDPGASAAVTHALAPVDTAHYRLLTEGPTRAGQVRVEGFVTVEGEQDWSVRSETTLNGVPFARELVQYHLEQMEGGTSVHVDHRIRGKTSYVEFILWLGTGRLRSEREKTLDRWLNSLRSFGSP